MTIGGLQKLTLLDYPQHLAAIIFTKGCNFRCPFCFNRDLVLNKLPTIDQRTILSFLKTRQGILDGVVVTGGEPLLQDDLAVFLQKVKQLGFKVKLDTNGSFPQKLKQLLDRKLVNYVAVDFKTTIARYPEVVRAKIDPEEVKKTFMILKEAEVLFEVRTTVVPGIHQGKTLAQMAGELKQLLGRKKPFWYWQNFQPRNCLDDQLLKTGGFSKKSLQSYLAQASRVYPAIKIRDY